MKNFICELIQKRPKLLIFLSLLLSISILPGLMKVDADFSYRGFYSSDNKYIKDYEKFVMDFSGDDNIAIVMSVKDGIFTPQNLNTIKEMTKLLEKAPNVLKVTSLVNHVQVYADGDDILIEKFIPERSEVTPSFLEAKKEQAKQDKIIPNYLISEDHLATSIIVRLRPSIKETINLTPAIEEIKEIAKSFMNSSRSLHVVGSPMVSHTFKNVSTQDLKYIVPLCILLISIVIFALFKKILPILLTFLVVALTVSSTFSFAGFMGVKYNNIVGAVPVILMAICIADCIHFFSTFSKHCKDDKGKDDALWDSTKHILFPTFLTTVSTCIGFLSLVTSEILPIKGLGILGAFGSAYAWLMTIFLCIPLANLFWRPKQQNKIKKETVNWEKYVAHLATYKVSYLTGVIVTTLLLGTAAIKNKVDSDPLTYLKDGNDFKIGTLFLEEKIGGVQGLELVIDSGEENGINSLAFAKKVEEFTNWLEKRRPYTKVISYLDTIKRVHKAMNQGDENYYKLPATQEELAQMFFFYELSLPQGNSITDHVSLDKQKARVRGLWTLHNSDSILKEFDAVKLKLKQLGLEGRVTGKMPIYHNMNTYVVETFFKSILSAIALIAFLMILIFRSFKIGLISLIPNIVPLIWGGGALFLLGRNFDMGTVVVGAICMGIAVDDTIHFLSNYAKNAKQGLSDKEIVSNTLRDVGPPLCSTTLTLVLGFLMFTIGDFVPNMNLGLMTAITLCFALLMDLVFLPVILVFRSS